MTQQQEKKNQRIAMFTSLGIHAALFLLFLFMVAWKAPNPPYPEYGIELNFGTDNQGSGEVQPTTPVGSQGTQQEEPKQPEQAEEQPVTETKPVESKPVQEEAVSKIESPVVVKEEKKPEVKEPVKPVEKKPEPKKEEVKPTVDQNAVFKPKTSESESKSTEAKAGEPGSHGDDASKTGDKGSEQGKVDAKALYGKQGGGGGGFGLQMSGWDWDQTPNIPKLPDNQSGRIVFEIEADEQGEIIAIRKVEGSLSLESERLLRKEIEKRSLVKKTPGPAPERSKGRVVFDLRLE